MSRTRRLRAVAGAVVVVVSGATLVGCGSSGSAASSSTRGATGTTVVTTDSRPTTTVDQEAKDKAEITALYRSWSKANEKIFDSLPDGSGVRLSTFLGGPLLVSIGSSIDEFRVAKNTARRPSKSRSTSRMMSLEVDGDNGSFESCEIDDWIIESSDGVVLNDRVMTFHDRWEARRTEAGWRLWAGTRISEAKGVVACA